MKKLREEILGLTPEESNLKSLLGHVLIWIPTALALIAFLFILFDLISNGWGTLTYNFPSFLTSNPYVIGPFTIGGSTIGPFTIGGAGPMIFGTFALVLGAMAIAIPLGVLSSIYMSEYLHDGKLKSFINQAVNNLAGVPSIIFGLFGLAYFINYLDIGTSSASSSSSLLGFLEAKPGPSLAVGMLVLGFMAMPIIVKATNNAINAVPKSFREASQALGASKWETIVTVTVPLASPGVSTGVILGIGRIIGETAAILFVAVVAATSNPYPSTILNPVMALTYQIYYNAILAPGASYNTNVTYAYALVLMLLVLMFMVVAIYIRYRALTRKKGW
jgi:phosphate transport system permease protein